MDKEILRAAWSAFRSRPLVWLLVSAASVPYVFALFVGAPAFVFIAGFVVTFMLMFLFWCLAAYVYGAETKCDTRAMLSEGRASMAYHWAKFLNLSVMAGAGVFVIMNIVPMLLYTVLAMVNPPSTITTGIIVQYITYVLVALPVTLFALVPQLAILRHDFEKETENPTGILRASYLLIKDRYKRALPLYLLPELVARTAMLLFTLLLLFAQDFVARHGIVFIPVLLVLALIEGAKTAYVAAAFNLLLDQIEVEEQATKKKKQQPAKGAAQQKKATTGKSGPSSNKKKK